MGTTLGLDVGTNSVGWAITDEDNNIIDLGVRLFPVGVKDDDYNKSGKEVPKNAARRQARSARRLHHRYKLRRKHLRKLLLELGMLPGTMNGSSRELYGLRKKALDEKIAPEEIGRLFLLLNQRRGFKSSRKDKSDPDSVKEIQGIKKQMEELTATVKDSGFRTLGEYFYSLFEQNADGVNLDEPVERIRDRFVYRSLYEEEFDAIWTAQQNYYPELLSDSNYQKIKENCIYYQRPLKSQKHLVAKCRFEPGKRVAPKSSFEFQEFRIWQTLNNMRVTYDSRVADPLTLEEKNIIAGALGTSRELSQAKIKQLIRHFPRHSKFAEMPDKIKGNTTNAALLKALGKEYFNSLGNDFKNKLWHTLFFASDNDWLVDYAQNKLHLNSQQAENYAKISLEPDYGNISTKAIRNILPFLKEGYGYSDACAKAGYHHSVEPESPDVLKDKVENYGDLRNPLVQRAVNETYKLVSKIIAEYGRPEIIRIEMARQLKKPKTKREEIWLNQKKKEKQRDLYRQFLSKRFGMPSVSNSTLLKFELWLELEFNEKDPNLVSSGLDINDFKKFARNMKTEDKEKFRLWLECGRISPYTGKVISLAKIFSSDIEIEHIIPYSKSMDNSFMNKTLAEREFNRAKGNQTAAQYLSPDPDEYEAFLRRIKHLPPEKAKRLQMIDIPDDFINSQLTNTTYIAKEIKKQLKNVCRDVRVSNGQATSFLRRLWNLNDILNPGGKNEKSRDDHRHHAIDALVTALTKEYYINKLSRFGEFDHRGRLTIRDFPLPKQGFIEEATEKLNRLFVSYYNKKRLVTTKKNKYVYSRAKNKQPQKTVSVRGPLHEETFYGRIHNPETGKLTYVSRKPVESLSSFKQVDKIVDPKIRKLIYDHVKNNGGNITRAMKVPVYMFTRQGRKIPVKTVRMVNASSNLVRLKKHPENEKYYNVAAGSNFKIAIYEDDKGNRFYENISFIEAAGKKMAGEPLFIPQNDNMSLLMELTHNDMVVVYNEHPDEIDWDNRDDLFNRLYRVIKFAANGDIICGIHNLHLKADTAKAPDVLRKNYNTLKAQKVNISLTGKLYRL